MHPQRKWREDLGVSQGRLARSSGNTSKEIAKGASGPLAVDQGLISKIESEDSFPGIKSAAQLCIASAKIIAALARETMDKITKLEAQLGRLRDPDRADRARFDLASARIDLERLSIAQPLRLIHYLPRDLAITYSQTMEAHQHGMAKGGIEEGIREGGGKAEGPSIVGNWKDWRARNEAGKAKNQPKRPRGGGGRGRKATKAAKAKKG